MLNNAELTKQLNAIHDGNMAAFEELYDDLKVPVYTIINRIIWDESTAEDILQEVFIKLYRLSPEPLLKNPRAYIFQMARNLTIDNVRKQVSHLSLDEIEDTVSQPADDFSMRMDIEGAMKALPSQECQIVTLHIIGELKFREIAEIMNIPLGTALWKYQKAITKLQKIIAGGPL
jgi:RNA polymerase sigma-70 factor (ECF subfamily)